MRTAIGLALTSKPPLSLFDVKQMGSALSEVIVLKEEVPVNVQVSKIRHSIVANQFTHLLLSIFNFKNACILKMPRREGNSGPNLL